MSDTCLPCPIKNNYVFTFYEDIVQVCMINIYINYCVLFVINNFVMNRGMSKKFYDKNKCKKFHKLNFLCLSNKLKQCCWPVIYIYASFFSLHI